MPDRSGPNEEPQNGLPRAHASFDVGKVFIPFAIDRFSNYPSVMITRISEREKNLNF